MYTLLCLSIGLLTINRLIVVCCKLKSNYSYVFLCFREKPIFLIIHRSKCGACQYLKNVFNKSIELPKYAKDFVMVNIEVWIRMSLILNTLQYLMRICRNESLSLSKVNSWAKALKIRPLRLSSLSNSGHLSAVLSQNLSETRFIECQIWLIAAAAKHAIWLVNTCEEGKSFL